MRFTYEKTEKKVGNSSTKSKSLTIAPMISSMIALITGLYAVIGAIAILGNMDTNVLIQGSIVAGVILVVLTGLFLTVLVILGVDEVKEEQKQHVQIIYTFEPTEETMMNVENYLIENGSSDLVVVTTEHIFET